LATTRGGFNSSTILLPNATANAIHSLLSSIRALFESVSMCGLPTMSISCYTLQFYCFALSSCLFVIFLSNISECTIYLPVCCQIVFGHLAESVSSSHWIGVFDLVRFLRIRTIMGFATIDLSYFYHHFLAFLVVILNSYGRLYHLI